MLPAIWHGSSDEAHEAINAFAHNCACYFEVGVLKKTCAGHEAFKNDQRMLNGLVWMRREQARLLREEGL